MPALRYRPEIDGLRAVAVLAVVLYHAEPGLVAAGFVGVDVFFVISGYLITCLLAAEWRRSGRIDFAAFYARRVRRLLPALLVVVVATMAAAALLLSRHGEVFEQTGESALASLLFVANVYFQHNTGGYFNAPAEGMPLLHLWSLAVEEQFYLLYPALLVLLLRYVPGGLSRRLAAVALLSFLFAQYLVMVAPERAFFLMPARFWELAAGALVALSTVPETKSRPALEGMLFPAGLLLVLLACAVTPRWGSFPGAWALPAVLGAVLVLLAVHRGAVHGSAAALLRSRPLVAVGLLSYSLYLWHWPLLAFDQNLRLQPAPPGWRLLLCLCAVGLAWLSWRFVEIPFRRTQGSASRRTLVAGAGFSVLGLAAVLLLARVDTIPEDARSMASHARRDQPAIPDGCHLGNGDDPARAMAPDCASLPGKEAALVYWGDSHAYAWQPFAARLAGQGGEAAIGATMNSCLPSSGEAGAATRGQSVRCLAHNRRVLARVAAGRVQTVVLALRWPMVLADDARARRSLARRLAALQSALDRLASVPRVIVIGPLPVLPHAAPSCISRGIESACAVDRRHFEGATRDSWQSLREIAAGRPNVELVDPADFFCDPLQCPVARDGYGLYWDDNHITATAAERFAERFLAEPAAFTVPATTATRPGPAATRKAP